jgi:hypothetical protein
MTGITPEELEELKALLEKATPGDWSRGGEYCPIYGAKNEPVMTAHYTEYSEYTSETSIEIAVDDQLFIIALRNAAPNLIRSAEELADAKLSIAQFIAQNEGLQSAIGPLAEELALTRERIAKWMILHSVATGHGDTTEDLLDELDVEITQLRARLEAAEKVVDAARILLQRANHNHDGGWCHLCGISMAVAAYDRTAK